MRNTVMTIGILAAGLPTIALAGGAIPMPGGGFAGPAALLAGIAVVAGLNHLRKRRE
jgi:hypothetical protein